MTNFNNEWEDRKNAYLQNEQLKADLVILKGDVDWNSSLITQNADNITLEATDRTDADNILSSSITQTADSIQLKTTDNATTKASVTVGNINWWTVKIAAKNIEIDGTTTFSSWYDPSSKLDSWDVWDMAYKNSVQGADIDSATISSAKMDSTVISWGWINTNLLTADNISAWTLTGRTVQTASSWDRVVLDWPSNSLKFYDWSNYNWNLYAYTWSLGWVSFDAIRTDASFYSANVILANAWAIFNNDLILVWTWSRIKSAVSWWWEIYYNWSVWRKFDSVNWWTNL